MKLRWLLFSVLCSLFSVLLLPPPPAALATCYCATPTADQCKCTASPPAGVDLFDGNLGGVAVKCTSQAEANSVFELKNAVCGGATETVPYCAPEILDPSRYRCYGRSFIPSSSVDPQLQTVPDGTWKEPVVGPFYFNTFNSPSGSFKVYICDSGLFCCTDQAGICSEAGIPKGGSCTPQDGPGNPAVCENIPPPGGSPTPPPLPTPDYPPPGTLCNQYQFTNEPHPLRPAPALVCEDKVPEPFNLSCANDVVPRLVIGRPRTTSNPGDSLDANTACSKSGCRWDCSREETLTEAIIGPVGITIDLTGLELPIAGIASRNCETGYCDVDRLNPATGNPALSDGFLMRNYTSWYLQGAIEQADQVPPDIQPKFLERALAYAGPLKKLIPQEILDSLSEQDIVGQREELIGEAVAGRTYDQIVGYIDGNRVISRPEAKQKGLTGPGHAIRLTDMKDHINPPYNPHSAEDIMWYTLWHQVPFTGKELETRTPRFSGHIDTAGEFFPTACLRSHADDRRCESDPKVLDAKFKVTSGLDSFRVYFPHLVEDDTLLMKLLQNALVAQEVPRTDAIPTYTELSQNLTNPDRLPEWTVSDDGTYKNAAGCKITNALYNPGDSLEAKRNKKQGIITGELQFKREVSYSYQVSDSCDIDPIVGAVPVEVSAPVPVHIRYSHMDEIGDRTVVGPGSIFKALYPDIPITIGDEIPNRPAESGLKYSCTAAGGCTAASTSHKGNPNAFFPWWGTTLELFHRKIQCMLDPLQQGCKEPTSPPIIPPGGIGGPTPPGGGTGTLSCNIPMHDTSCKPIDWGSAFIQAYVDAYNKDNNSSWTLVREPWAQQMVEGNSGGLCPGFLLTLWLEESGGSAVGSYDLGCIYPLGGGGQQTRKNQHPISDAEVSAMPAADRCYHGLCARTLQEYRQSILGEQISCLDTYTNAIGDFQTFMCQYSGEADTDPNTPYRQCTEFKNNPNFPVNICKIWAALGYPPKP